MNDTPGPAALAPSPELVRQLQQKAVPPDPLCRVLEVRRSGYDAAGDRRRSQAAACEASVQWKAAIVGPAVRVLPQLRRHFLIS